MEGKDAAEEKKKAGNAAFNEKKYDEAIELYTEAMQLDPANPVYVSNRSACWGSKGDWQNAAADAKKCIDVDPDFIKGYWRLATAQMELKLFHEAQSTLMAALEKDPDNGELQKQLRLTRAKRAASSRPSAPPTRALDQAAQKELMELRDQLETHTRDHQTVSARLQSVARDEKHEELTLRGMGTVPEGTPLYRAIGKMFLLSDANEITEVSNRRIEALRKQQADLTSRQEYLARRITSTESNMQDILKA